MDKPQTTKYRWDKERGVVRVKDDQQVQQLLVTSSNAFMQKCGKLLVEALNAEI